MTRAQAALIAGWCATAMAAACGAARPRPAAAPASAEPPAGEPRAAAPQSRAEAGDRAHAQIDALDRQITDELARAQLAPPADAACTGPACPQAASPPVAMPPAADPACHPAATERCTDACTVATSICTNQQKICDLANQLAGDDWAAGKCERARASCRAAHDNCCSCVI